MTDKLIGLEDQKRVSENCAGCGIPVGPHNDSGWRVFVDGGTRPLCGICDIDFGKRMQGAKCVEWKGE